MAETLPPPTETTEPTQLHYVTVDQSFDSRQAARDAANDRLTQELNEGGRAKRFFKSIWKGGALKEYTLLKYERQAQAHIEHAGDVLLFQAPEEQRARAKMATIERFLHDDEAMIHRDANEERAEVAGDSDLAKEVKKLIRQNVEGTLSDDAMLEERTRLLNAYHETKGSGAIGEGRMRVDNMLEITAAVKGAIDHGESLDSVIANMKISMGEARSGVRTEAKYGRVEKIADKLSRSKFGSLVGPELVASATTVAASIARFGSHSVVGALAHTLVPGVASGLWAGLRENKRMKDDRVQHARDMAVGKEITGDSERREDFERTRYATASATEMVGTLGQHFNDEKPLDSKDAYETALAALSAVEARIRLSDSQNVDLISYSSAGAVEEERLLLDIARAQAKVAAESRLDPEMRALLGVDENVTLQSLVNERAEAFLTSIEEDRTQKDRVFAKMKLRAVGKATLKGALTGILIGGLFQEGMAAMSDTRIGLVEQAWSADNKPYDGTMHQTLAHGLINGEHGPGHVGPSDTYTDHRVGENGSFSLSSDQSMIENPDGTIKLENANGDPIIDNLTVNEDGSLSKDSLAEMRAAGLTVEDTSHMVDLPPTTEMHDATLDEYMDKNSENTTKVTRDFWYDNDTARFDENELALHWGENGGAREGGGYQFSIASMTEDGSSHGGENLKLQEAAQNGELKMAVSASADSQTDVFMVDVNPDGTIDIPEDHPAAAFFKVEDGQTVFTGKYAEVVEISGVDEDGAIHIRPIATEIGDDSARGGNFPVAEEVPRQQLVTEYKITSPGYDTPGDFTEMAPVIPVVSRRPLEKVRYQQNNLEQRGGYSSGYGEYMSAAEKEQLKDESSPRLWENPDATLRPHEELSWYKNLVRKKRGTDYVNGIDKLISSSPELSNLSPNLRNIVKIPVNAAGDFESKNIYDVLTKAYAQQDKEALGESLVLLHVNWFDDLMNDPDKRATIEHTKAEIERAKADYPDLKIATIETEWERATLQGGVIGHVARRLNDAALFAVEGAMSRGQIDPDQDILLIRNDADPKGMSKHYLKRFADSAEKYDRADVFTGTTSFDNTKASDLPGFVMAANFMQSLDLLATAREGRVHTAGANFAVRASILAAVGGNGFDDDDMGAGTDDVRLGERIHYARTREVIPSTGVASYFKAFRKKKAAGYTSGGAVSSGKRKVAVRVVGARIDTDSDREEVLYRRGQPIIHTWDGSAFDSNGYSDRNAGLNGDFDKEDVANDSETVIERLRNDMEGTINVRAFRSDALIQSALALMFAGLKDRSPTEAYRLTHDGGRLRLEFTDIGKAEIVKRLTRDSKGKFDTYGGRKLRQMYGESKAGAKRQPTHQSMIRV